METDVEWILCLFRECNARIKIGEMLPIYEGMNNIKAIILD